MTTGMGIFFALFACLVLAWPSDRARRLSDFGLGGPFAIAAALVGWVLSSLALMALPLLAAWLVMKLVPDGLFVWRWAGIAVLFWLATSGKLTPALAYRPMAANDNAAVKGFLRTILHMTVQGYNVRLALVVAALAPQFLDSDAAAEPQILFAGLLFSAFSLLSATYFGLFPLNAHRFLNVLPARRKALKTGMNAFHQHGQTRISYRRQAA
nr:hypothetical protein [uncultured Gellertiella sp.]